MSKKKRKGFKSRVNPDKSNKMIYAVVAGLTVLFALFVFLTTSGRPSGSRDEVFSDTLDYLKKTQGIIDLRIEGEAGRVEIVYDRNDRKDFVKIARYAVIRLSNRVPDSEIRVTLYRDRDPVSVYSVTAKAGAILTEDR